mgnify:CR=1 FL=1
MGPHASLSATRVVQGISLMHARCNSLALRCNSLAAPILAITPAVTFLDTRRSW